jgi:hypothetical protein
MSFVCYSLPELHNMNAYEYNEGCVHLSQSFTSVTNEVISLISCKSSSYIHTIFFLPTMFFYILQNNAFTKAVYFPNHY